MAPGHLCEPFGTAVVNQARRSSGLGPLGFHPLAYALSALRVPLVLRAGGAARPPLGDLAFLTRFLAGMSASAVACSPIRLPCADPLARGFRGIALMLRTCVIPRSP